MVALFRSFYVKYLCLYCTLGAFSLASLPLYSVTSTLYIFWTHIRERGKIQRNKFRRKGYFYPFRGIYLAV
jgi:hypothetical protein